MDFASINLWEGGVGGNSEGVGNPMNAKFPIYAQCPIQSDAHG